MKQKLYHIERKQLTGSWRKVFQAEGVSREWTHGYIFAIAGEYPCAPHRVIETNTGKIVQEFTGNTDISI